MTADLVTDEEIRSLKEIPQLSLAEETKYACTTKDLSIFRNGMPPPKVHGSAAEQSQQPFNRRITRSKAVKQRLEPREVTPLEVVSIRGGVAIHHSTKYDSARGRD